MPSPDIESLIAAAQKRHMAYDVKGNIRCAGHAFDMPWPCPDRLLIDALTSERESDVPTPVQLELIRQYAEGMAELRRENARLRAALGEPNA